MVSQLVSNVENNFTKGLITEATGLNFPENACTSAENCTFTLVGDVTRRQGIDYEVNHALLNSTRGINAIATYKWNNVGGDGETQIVVLMDAGTLFFYLSTAATSVNPLSTQILTSTVAVSRFTANGATFDSTQECTFADGNGYLFVYNPNCDPFYCTYNSTTKTVVPTLINLQTRDFTGVSEGNVPVNFRPLALTNSHLYNLENQGWSTAATWNALSSTVFTIGVGTVTFSVSSGLSVSLGEQVLVGSGFAYIFPNNIIFFTMSGTVTGYSGTSLTLDITSISNPLAIGQGNSGFIAQGYQNDIAPSSFGHIQSWNTAIGNYPSNGDQWWSFKDSTDTFNPATTYGNVTFGTGQAPQGFFLLNPFNQQRGSLSGVNGITDITTNKRPSNGAWFQGRVWYTGVNSNFQPSGTAQYTTWTENIYFSQIVQSPIDFGSCYQVNDPTSETLFDLLPTDGGVITIQGAGAIFKLFPIQNGMLVFAANGVWFITGSQGIGFSANDYTITKISAVRSISSYSFVDVNGLPYFWNEEGIYTVEPTQGGALAINPITVGTILSFYNNIPTISKQYARGAYDPINYVIQWLFKSTTEVSINDRYTFDGILNFNTYNKAFYPYTVDNSISSLNSIVYVVSPGGLNTPDSMIKYVASVTNNITFADEHDTTYVDWASQTSMDYTSTFTTGFKLHGQAQKRFQLEYLYVYSRADTPTSYYVQGCWDYATTGNSGRWSTAQLVNNWTPNFGMLFRRHRIRGRGIVLQLQFTSLSGQPFDIMGWSAVETVNASA